MSHYRALLKYALDINFINIPFSVILAAISGPIWGLVSFLSIGIFIGFLGFNFFKKNEYYLYFNLGYNKISLLKHVVIINLFVSIIFGLIGLLLSLIF